MQARKPTQKQKQGARRAQEPNWADVPDGFGNGEKPETLDLRKGETVTGQLGQVFQGKKPGSRYRTLTTYEGERYFVGGADLQSLMEYPSGTPVRLTYQGEIDTGKGNPMKKWRKQVPEALLQVEASHPTDGEDLPF